MAATSKYHITITSSAGTKGFVTKRYSSRQRPDSLFGSRFSTGDISYSTMNRWQRFAQSTWLGGAFQKFLEDVTKFRLSNNVDILTHGEFKLSKKISASLYDGATAKHVGIYYNDAIYFAEGRYIKYTEDNFATAPSTSKDFGAGAVVNDLEIHDGKLWAAVGAVGVWSHGTSDHTTWTELLDTAATIPASYLKSWDVNLYITYTDVVKYYNGSDITTVKNFSSSGDSNYYFKKPEVAFLKLHIPCNIAGAVNGSGAVYQYNGTDFDLIFSSPDPVGEKMCVYENNLLFVVYGAEKVSVKTYNGSSTTTLKSFDITKGTTIFGSGLLYGSGVIYGAGSDQYLDPNDMIVWKNFLVLTMQRTAQQNSIIIYDGYGWTEHANFAVAANFSAKMWLVDRNLYFGGSDGNIYCIDTNYAASGYLQGSLWDANMQDIDKLFADIKIKHEALESGDSVEVFYRDEHSGSFISLGSNAVVGTNETLVAFPTGANSVISSQLEYKVLLRSSDGSTTPVVQDVIIRYILAPDNDKRVFEYTVEATKKMKLLDNTFETRTPAEIIADLWALKESGEVLTLVDEDGASHSVILSDTSPEVVTAFAGDSATEKYVYVKLFEL